MTAARLAAAVLLCAAGLLPGCGGCRPDPAPADSPAPAPSAPPPAPAKPAGPPVMTATVTVTDLDGTPLAGMVPIVTRKPNAFDPPVTRGDPTDAAGRSVFAFPAAEKLCLRVWDADLRFFANNYFDVGPVTEPAAAETPVTMAPAAEAHGVLLLPGGGPAANTPVSLMLSHPTRGPWWPAEAVTGADGAFSFPNVPPGVFQVALTAAPGTASLEEATLQPGAPNDLGALTLTPAP
ncbi:MAG TPA: carboxypeptidase-like regulatory domain-containing protein [Candidatus Hydrogenedentes bacterium]|nr:carboxypeptidase-like regulatory domain-containing protein [Candidatus Hydrogenedentota bacterium]